MSDTKWVVSKYAPETGEKFEVAHDNGVGYFCDNPHGQEGRWYLSKSEYIPCPPPERWERVPIDRYFDITNSGETVSPKERHGSITCLETQRFLIIDGAIVLERRVE